MINNQTLVESIRFRNFIFESIRIFLKIVHYFEILKAKLQLMKDILGKLKIFAFWNLDQEFGLCFRCLKRIFENCTSF